MSLLFKTIETAILAYSCRIWKLWERAELRSVKITAIKNNTFFLTQVIFLWVLLELWQLATWFKFCFYSKLGHFCNCKVLFHHCQTDAYLDFVTSYVQEAQRSEAQLQVNLDEKCPARAWALFCNLFFYFD